LECGVLGSLSLGRGRGEGKKESGDESPHSKTLMEKIPMTPLLLTLTAAALLYGDAKDTPRKPNPLYPSLPQLTDDEEDQLDRIISRFVKADIGELRGEDSLRARKEFDKLGPEAIPALIRGLNEAAQIEGSCPAVLIAKKLRRLLGNSEDTELLLFARENIGVGVTASRHMSVLRDLKVMCMLRRNLVLRAGGGTPATTATDLASKSPGAMTVAELTEVVTSDRGSRFKDALAELAQRRGDDALEALASAAANLAESEPKAMAHEQLVKAMTRLSLSALKTKLKDDSVELRATAAEVAGNRGFLSTASLLIELLNDEEARVREAAHQALVKLNKGTDLGPDATASDAERSAAVKKWRDWLPRQGGR
jgi:hypothetical protein